MTIKTTKTTIEVVELQLPIFKKSTNGMEYFAIITEGVYHKMFRTGGFINVQNVEGQDPYQQYFDFNDCPEEEFMEAWEAGLKSMSFMPTLTLKNIEACPKF